MNQKLLPGEFICNEEDFIRGHGTQKINSDPKISSTIYGVPKTINKLISVISTNKFNYLAEVGDVVIGRVVEIWQKKWKTYLSNTECAMLNLSSITLPNLEQRRKIESDEMKMREYFDLNDIVVAEVQKVSRGKIALHTRNEKYRKLTNGVLVELPSGLIKRMKQSFLDFEDLEVIIGINGIVYVGKKDGGYVTFEKITEVIRYLEQCKQSDSLIDYAEIKNLVS